MKQLLKSKRNRSLLIIGTAIILLLTFTVTFAYLAPLYDDPENTNVNITGDALDNLTFEEGNPINLVIGSHNLNTGDANVTSETKPKAILKPNETNNTATETYKVYLGVYQNTFVYSSGETETPEIIMQVFNPAGVEVKSVTGLNYTTTNGVSGFDITTVQAGFIKIADDYTISASGSATTQEWTFKFTVLNLSTDQAANANALLDVKIEMQKEEIVLGEVTPPVSASMVPVEVQSNNSLETTTTTSSTWYDYENQIWANASVVTTSSLENYETEGTSVLTSDVIGEYVWIPRFKYYEDGSGNYEVVLENSTVPKSYGTGENGSFKTHEAFTKNGIELDGFWVSKYMLSNESNSLAYSYEANGILYSKVNNNVALYDIVDPENVLLVQQQINELNNTPGFNLPEGNEISMISFLEDSAIYIITNSNLGSNLDIYFYDSFPYVSGASNKNTTINNTGVMDYVTPDKDEVIASLDKIDPENEYNVVNYNQITNIFPQSISNHRNNKYELNKIEVGLNDGVDKNPDDSIDTQNIPPNINYVTLQPETISIKNNLHNLNGIIIGLFVDVSDPDVDPITLNSPYYNYTHGTLSFINSIEASFSYHIDYNNISLFYNGIILTETIILLAQDGISESNSYTVTIPIEGATLRGTRAVISATN